ncbi:hypothetical protein [Brachybacterium sp. AOP3-A1-3]|uniref:hypothetical protein n=1 Tax=Brachybacterium sp. AOP3-A1-3 TaxID=3457699 RepID=UPI0040343064
MAYRFNPPPNWPIDDAAWSPPPGWQPDPSWGPAPEGWNFWIQDEVADADLPSQDAANPENPENSANADDSEAGTVVSSAPADEQAVTSPSEEAEASADAPGPDPSPQDAAAPATDEYPGPDLEADLAQQAPYETAEPAEGAEPYGTAEPYEAAAPQQGSPTSAPAAPAAGYDQQHQGYGTPAGSDYPASPAFGQESANSMAGSPSSGSEWTAATATGEAPKKGAIARFWWVGCIVLFLVVALIVAIAGGIYLFRDGPETAGGGGKTTTQEETTPEEEATSDSEEPASPDPTTDLPVIGDDAEAKDIVGENGSGSLAVQMEWKKAEDLPSSYGGTVEPAKNGEYLVVTAEMTVTEGQMAFPSYFFQVMTPYGGAVDDSSEGYGLEASGRDYDTNYEFTEGESYTIVLLYDFVRAGGNTLQYDNYVDVYTWDVPA